MTPSGPKPPHPCSLGPRRGRRGRGWRRKLPVRTGGAAPGSPGSGAGGRGPVTEHGGRPPHGWLWPPPPRPATSADPCRALPGTLGGTRQTHFTGGRTGPDWLGPLGPADIGGAARPILGPQASVPRPCPGSPGRDPVWKIVTQRYPAEEESGGGDRAEPEREPGRVGEASLLCQATAGAANHLPITQASVAAPRPVSGTVPPRTSARPLQNCTGASAPGPRPPTLPGVGGWAQPGAPRAPRREGGA